MAARMREVDWSRTAVGPTDQWPHSVRTIVRMMLTSRYAMWMGWGPDLTFFYNDAYAHDDARREASVGARQAGAAKCGRKSGRTSARASSRSSATGEATWDEGLLLFLERSGFPEETYHTFSYSPLHDDDGDDRRACSASSPRKPTA